MGRLDKLYGKLLSKKVQFGLRSAPLCYKARLDKFWHNQDAVYDFRAQLQGTGSRSEVLYE